MTKDLCQLGTIKMMLQIKPKLIISLLVKSMILYTLQLKTISWELYLRNVLLVCFHMLL